MLARHEVNDPAKSRRCKAPSPPTLSLARTILCEIYDCLILDYVYACSSTLLNTEKHASIVVKLLVKTLLDLETLEEDISPEARAVAEGDCSLKL